MPSINAHNIFVYNQLFEAVFAPTDEAFDEVPPPLQYYLTDEVNVETLKSVLLYHVVDGEVLSTDLSDGLVVETFAANDDLIVSKIGTDVKINDADVVDADIAASNGVVHVIDKVLIPSNIFIPTLLDIGNSDAAFSTLVAAVTRAELVDALSAPGAALTVFAPTNAGFDMLPAGTVTTLLEDEDKSPLTDILKYHVVPEFITFQDILDGRTSATTLQGAELTFSVTDDEESFTVNGILVLASAAAGNGIGYVIGEVLLPPAVVASTSPPSPAPTKAPTSMEDDGALATSTFVAALVSAVAFLMV